MSLPNDAWGLPLTTSEEAAEAYRLGVDRMLAYTLGVDEALERAIELDPNFALAHSQLGLFHLFRGNGKRAAELANQAHELAERATPREQRHDRPPMAGRQFLRRRRREARADAGQVR